MRINNKEFDPWPIDGKCFCQDIVTDFAELKALGGSVAFGNPGEELNSVAFYTSEGHECDELIEMRWRTNDYEVLIMTPHNYYKIAKDVAAKYAKWVEECECDGQFPYKCVISGWPDREYVSVRLYKEAEE